MKSIAILVLLMAFRFGLAQTSQYRFTRINVDHGLSHNQVKTIFKDRQGFLWIGTISGLNRYDGYTIKIFRNNPNDSTSLISSDVNNVFEGPGGKMWIHTWSGTNVYDPLTERFDRNADRALRKLSIPEGEINDILTDSRGDYWFIHSSEGIFRYSEQNGETVGFSHREGDTTSISTNQVSSMSEDNQGNIWCLHGNGILEKINAVNGEVVYRDHTLATRFRNEVLEYHLIADRDGDLWCFVANNNSGVFFFDASTMEWRHYDAASRPALNANIVRSIVQGDDGLIWIATDHGGINLLDKEAHTIRYVLHNPEDEKSLSQNSVNVLYKDRDGIMWAGTFKHGVSYYHKNINRFQLLRNQVSNPASLPYNDINVIVEDDQHNLWIGTNGGGLVYYDRGKNTFRQYLHDPLNKNSLSANVIVSMFFGHDKTLWIGTYFGGLNAFDGKKFTRYQHDPDDPRSIADNNIWEIFEDSRKNLWIGTLSQGVDCFDRRKNEFYHYNMADINSVHANYITSFMEDSRGNLWIGTGYGVDFLDRQSGRFTHYIHQLDDVHSLSNNSVLSIVEDSRGLIWVATHGGLNLFHPETKTFSVWNDEDGLPHNSILTVVEDNRRNLWVSTPHGISNLEVHHRPGADDSLSLTFKNFDEADGLQGIQFNENAACKTSQGELIFAGSNGLNLFKPEDIPTNLRKPAVILTDFQVFNKSLRVGESVDGKVILRRAIDRTDSITLEHSDNVFSLEFASPSQFHPEKIKYQYKMEGFDREWITTNAAQRRVTYTNLDPGNYAFLVKAANNDGIWNENPTRLMITVLPPFWKTRTAFVIYALTVLATLFFARWLVLYNERISFRIQREREEAHRMHELDMIKIKFFTNISHEFRTPLTLILTPLERLLKTTTEGDQQKQFQMIHRNARRLLNLVNQLLDFRKIEMDEVKFNPSEGDIVTFIREVFNSFSDLSEKKNIHFSFHTPIEELETLFDQDKLEKILFNLLSNAFKFTPENGSVSLRLNVLENSDTRSLQIQVADSGIGIAEDKQEKIFERFFQSDVPKSMLNQGSGIGLSITHEFVKIHGGSITVESAPGKGSCFTVLIPVVRLTQEVADPAKITASLAVTGTDEYAFEQAGKKPVLLLVEDNEDFRFYLKDNLKLHYTILEAGNGQHGLQRAIETVPDLVVSDIMMPEMDGIDLCKRLKADARTSHIPVILLTARSAEEQKIAGYESGASDYVTKPFNFEILQSRIQNLIAQRQAFQKTFHNLIDIKTAQVDITSMDERLIEKAIKIVEDNLADPDFSVERFSREVGMSRVHLYKKLLSLTGKSPIEFIRTIRLQRAAQLLEKSQLSVSEIAYQVGFNNPKYFSRYFKHQFNILPSLYANGKKG